MENVILILHLIIALVLIGAVLLQRSEGGGLGMGGDSNFMSNRSASTALNKLTWIVATMFLTTSLILTIFFRKRFDSGSFGGSPSGSRLQS